MLFAHRPITAVPLVLFRRASPSRGSVHLRCQGLGAPVAVGGDVSLGAVRRGGATITPTF
jgi:hypothetical protein